MIERFSLLFFSLSLTHHAFHSFQVNRRGVGTALKKKKNKLIISKNRMAELYVDSQLKKNVNYAESIQ